jgi:hypothetical protein
MRGYNKWIEHQRKFRINLLNSSPEIKNTKIYRVCQDCDEICLCHEMNCPNCGSDVIIPTKINDIEGEVGSLKRMRCLKRFKDMQS